MYLGHWIAYMPGEERMAISRLDREEGVVKLVHRFTSLSDEVEASVLPDLIPGQGSLRKAGVLRLTSGKLSEQRSKFRFCYMAHMWCKKTLIEIWYTLRRRLLRHHVMHAQTWAPSSKLVALLAQANFSFASASA